MYVLWTLTLTAQRPAGYVYFVKIYLSTLNSSYVWTWIRTAVQLCASPVIDWWAQPHNPDNSYWYWMHADVDKYFQANIIKQASESVFIIDDGTASWSFSISISIVVLVTCITLNVLGLSNHFKLSSIFTQCLVCCEALMILDLRKYCSLRNCEFAA